MHIDQESTEEEAAAIAAAVLVAWPQASGTDADWENAVNATTSRWRFSGRWWHHNPRRRRRP